MSVLPSDVSVSTVPVLPLDSVFCNIFCFGPWGVSLCVSVLQPSVLLLYVSIQHQLVLSQDVSVLQQLVLPLDVSVQQQPYFSGWSLVYSSLCCTLDVSV
jgi:hypothetical protein